MSDYAAAGRILLRVKCEQGSEMHFTIKKSTPLRKLMDAYCDHLGLRTENGHRLARFFANGERVAPEDTVEKLGLEDLGIILADFVLIGPLPRTGSPAPAPAASPTSGRSVQVSNQHGST